MRGLMDNALRYPHNTAMRLLFCSIASSVAASALAQSLPTDTDLRTAYCITVAKSQLIVTQQMLNGEPERSPAFAFVQKTHKEQADLVNRLQSYLLPKLSGLDAEPLLLAVKRAVVDLEEGKAAASACASRCEPSLQNGRPTQRWSACVDECLVSPLARRLRACSTPDWLPY